MISKKIDIMTTLFSTAYSLGLHPINTTTNTTTTSPPSLFLSLSLSLSLSIYLSLSLSGKKNPLNVLVHSEQLEYSRVLKKFSPRGV